MPRRSRLRFFLRSGVGDIGFLGRILLAEGHDVQLYCESPTATRVLEGLVPRARSRQPSQRSVVLFDGAGHGAEGEQLRRQGHLVLGAYPFDRDLELKRGRAMRLFERAGISIPETVAFRTLPEGIAWLRRQDDEERFFWKPDGNVGTAQTVSGKASRLIRYLDYVRHEPTLRREITGFILQKEVGGGAVAELSTEGWYHHERGWVLPFNGTLEEKRMMAGGLGPRTGAEVSVVWTYPDDEPEPAVQTVMCLTDLLEEHHAIGPVDVNAIGDRRGILHGLEASPRIGIPAFQALVALFPKGTVGEQLEAFIAGELERFEVRADQMALTLQVSIPPYPVDDPKAGKKNTGSDLDDLLLDRPDRMMPQDVMAVRGEAQCAGSDGRLAVLVAVGDDLDQLREEVLEEAKALDIEDKQYRIDPLQTGAASAEKRWNALKAAGLLPAIPPLGAPARPPRFLEKRDREGGGDDEEGASTAPPDDSDGGDDTPFVEDM